MSLNLAKRPFLNRRPVRRVGYLLWALGLILAGVNCYLYWDYLSGQGAAETGLREVIDQLQEESRLLEGARVQLAGLETDELNRKVEFVNLRIQQRTFSWSRLFDVFAATLPSDVRLSSLTPKFGGARGLGRIEAGNSQSDPILLEIRGAAKSSEALLEFLDRLFAHSAFDNPDLHQERGSQDEGVIEFRITTSFRPDIAFASSPTGSEDGEGTE